MRLVSLGFKPGITRDITEYGSKGTWYACDKVRFNGSFPEKIGGWQKYTAGSSSPFLGVARSIKPWSALNGTQYIGFGTHLKYYIAQGGAYFDITPIRETATLGTDPFTTASGSTTVTVTDVAHGAAQGDFVTFSGATGPINDVPASELNAEHQIAMVVDSDNYTIVVTTAATGNGSGGGAAVEVAYQIAVGLQSSFSGNGWGSGGWGVSPWGGPGDTSVPGAQLRLWGNDNFGEDLIFNVRNGGLYYWDQSGGTSARAVALASMAGASDVPTVTVDFLVSDTDRHAIAFGCNPLGSAEQDRMHIRWADTENAVNWTPTTENAAGDLQLSFGSEILCAYQARQEMLVWTDVALYSMRYVGAKFVFGVEVIDTNLTLMGPNAKAGTANMVFWMGIDAFYIYDGRVREVPCPIRDLVFLDLDLSDRRKVWAGINAARSEVTWHYPTVGAFDNDRYVTFNYGLGVWTYGTLTRTTWADRGLFSYPIAAGEDGHLYYHEFGFDDGSTNPPSAIEAYIESGPLELEDGYRFAFVRRVIPDVSFRDSSNEDASVEISLKPRNYPGGAAGTTSDNSVVVGATITRFTEDLRVRLRARSVTYKIASSDVGVAWRQGVPRLELRPDGRK